jgi:hypothetical protein
VEAALKFYSRDLISNGEAASMLGLSRIQFLDLLRRSLRLAHNRQRSRA